jgi:hypothetical protein
MRFKLTVKQLICSAVLAASVVAGGAGALLPRTAEAAGAVTITPHRLWTGTGLIVLLPVMRARCERDAWDRGYVAPRLVITRWALLYAEIECWATEFGYRNPYPPTLPRR